MRIKNPALSKMLPEAAQRALSKHPQAVVACTARLNAGGREALALATYFSHAEAELSTLSTTYHIDADVMWDMVAERLTKTVDMFVAELFGYDEECDGKGQALAIVEETLLQITMEIAASAVASAWGEAWRERALLDAAPDSFDLRCVRDAGARDAYFDALLTLYRGVTIGYDDHEAEEMASAQVLLDSLTWQDVLKAN